MFHFCDVPPLNFLKQCTCNILCVVQVPALAVCLRMRPWRRSKRNRGSNGDVVNGGGDDNNNNSSDNGDDDGRRRRRTTTTTNDDGDGGGVAVGLFAPGTSRVKSEASAPWRLRSCSLITSSRAPTQPLGAPRKTLHREAFHVDLG